MLNDFVKEIVVDAFRFYFHHIYIYIYIYIYLNVKRRKLEAGF